MMLMENTFMQKQIVLIQRKYTKTEAVRVEIVNLNGQVVGTVTSSVNGKVSTQVFKGTDAEVKAKIDSLKN